MTKTQWLVWGAAAGLTARAAGALSMGSLAFVGFDSDGDDSFALAVLQQIASGEEIFLRDEEWNGADAFVGAAEGEVKWITPALMPGTVVQFSFTNHAIDAVVDPFQVSHGALESTPTGADALDLSGSGETLWAFQGASNSPALFLAAISTDEFDAGLAGTGLTAGLTAVGLATAVDVAAYAGPLSGQATYADYLPLIGNPENWATGDGTGDQSDAVVPFPAAAGFTLAPEPGTSSLLGIGLCAGLARRRRR